MTAAQFRGPVSAGGHAGLTIESLQMGAVWLMMASSFYVTMEPAPTDLLFCLVCAVFFMGRGLTVTKLAVPLILLLTLYNLGGFLSYLPVKDEPKTGWFIVISCYMAVTGVFFCFYLQKDTALRFAVFKNGYIVGAVIGSAVVLTAYANVGGIGSLFSPLGRAQGTFKDPNVFSTYLVLPALLMVQEMLTGTRRFRVLRLVGLLIILPGIFLAFSRGAWVNFMLSAVLTVALTFMLAAAPWLRRRITIVAAAGAILIVGGFAALLSVDSVATMFEDRAAVLKPYDGGEFGRFGNQLNAVPLLMERPLGFGPLQFGQIFRSDPHNVFLNAFASYGWLGGISYAVLILLTVIVGFRSILIDAPWRMQSIALYSVFVAMALQGIQIDTDHWRHFYWILGLVWGFYAASAAYLSRSESPGREGSGKISASI